MFMVQIEESKLDKMSEYAEKMLKYGGKLMSCLEEMSEESGMGERGGSYGNRGEGGRSMMGGRGGYGNRGYGERGGYGNREEEEDWDEYEEMNERRGVRGSGRGRGRR